MSKRVLISIIAITLLASGAAFALWHAQNTDEDSNDETKTVKVEDPDDPITEADRGNDNDDEEPDDRESSENNDQDESSSQQSPQDDRQNVSPTMTSWDYDRDRRVATIRAHVDNVSSGTCEVVFTKSGESSVRREASLGLQGSIYVCQGWDIERSAFPASGEWMVRVKFSSDSAQGASQTQTVNIR